MKLLSGNLRQLAERLQAIDPPSAWHATDCATAAQILEDEIVKFLAFYDNSLRQEQFGDEPGIVGLRAYVGSKPPRAKKRGAAC